MDRHGLEVGHTQQAVKKPFSVSTELQNKQTEIVGPKLGEKLNKDSNSNNNTSRNENENNDDEADDDNDSDEDSSSSDDSDEYETESEAEVNEDDYIITKEAKAHTEVYKVGSKETGKQTHNEFTPVRTKEINTSKDDVLKDENKKNVKTIHSFDKERKMLTFSDTSSEFYESENEENDVKSSDYKTQETFSPTKVLTRKVAVKADRKTEVDKKILVQKVPGDSNDILETLELSSFAPKEKSPLVISKERVLTSNVSVPLKPDLKSDKFMYHSDSDSNGRKVKGDYSDSENSDASESEQKTKTRNFFERKTLQFDDDDEWDDKTPVISRTREARSSLGTEDHDRTLVEEPEKKGKMMKFSYFLVALGLNYLVLRRS